jgi:hypothetical protein
MRIVSLELGTDSGFFGLNAVPDFDTVVKCPANLRTAVLCQSVRSLSSVSATSPVSDGWVLPVGNEQPE